MDNLETEKDVMRMMQTIHKPSVLPIYGIAAVFVLYNLFFPMYQLIHFLICAALAAACYLVLRRVCPDRIVEVEIPEPKPNTGNAALDEAIEQGRYYIAELNRLNDAIPDQKLSDALYEIEDLVKKTMQQVEQEQRKLPEIRKMMQYYLPTTIKLVQKYAELQNRRELERVDQMLRQIETVLKTIQTAFRKQLDSLYEYDVVDITADIQVLEQMLASQGLTDQRDFETERRTNNG